MGDEGGSIQFPAKDVDGGKTEKTEKEMRDKKKHGKTELRLDFDTPYGMI